MSMTSKQRCETGVAYILAGLFVLLAGFVFHSKQYEWPGISLLLFIISGELLVLGVAVACCGHLLFDRESGDSDAA